MLDGKSMMRTHEIVCLDLEYEVRTRGRDLLAAHEKCALSSPPVKTGPEQGTSRLRIYRGRWVEGLPGLRFQIALILDRVVRTPPVVAN
jgi:hypothetical protein